MYINEKLSAEGFARCIEFESSEEYIEFVTRLDAYQQDFDTTLQLVRILVQSLKDECPDEPLTADEIGL